MEVPRHLSDASAEVWLSIFDASSVYVTRRSIARLNRAGSVINLRHYAMAWDYVRSPSWILALTPPTERVRQQPDLHRCC